MGKRTGHICPWCEQSFTEEQEAVWQEKNFPMVKMHNELTVKDALCAEISIIIQEIRCRGNYTDQK